MGSGDLGKPQAALKGAGSERGTVNAVPFQFELPTDDLDELSVDHGPQFSVFVSLSEFVRIGIFRRFS